MKAGSADKLSWAHVTVSSTGKLGTAVNEAGSVLKDTKVNKPV